MRSPRAVGGLRRRWLRPGHGRARSRAGDERSRRGEHPRRRRRGNGIRVTRVDHRHRHILAATTSGRIRGVLHETRDQTAMFVPVTKDARLLESPEDIAPSIASAGGEACSAPSGPVYVGIPNDFLTAKGRRSLLSAPVAPRWPELDEECLREVSGLLSSARFPLIWAGGGALRSGAGALLGEMASKLAAPAITTYGSRGLLAPEHPCFVPGPVHVREVGELWDEADVVLAVGTDFDAMMTQNWRMPAPARLISINTDTVEANKNYRSDFTLVGDARWVLAQINARIEVRPGLEKIRKRLADIGCSVEGWIASDEPQAAAFLDAIDQVVAPETAVVADMCIPGYWLADFVASRTRERLPIPWVGEPLVLVFQHLSERVWRARDPRSAFVATQASCSRAASSPQWPNCGYR